MNGQILPAKDRLEGLDDSHQFRTIIRENNFDIEESAYYLFPAFVTEGVEWSVSIRRATEAEERERLLSLRIGYLQLSEHIKSKLQYKGIDTVRDLLSHINSSDSLGDVDVFQVKEALHLLEIPMRVEMKIDTKEL